MEYTYYLENYMFSSTKDFVRHEAATKAACSKKVSLCDGRSFEDQYSLQDDFFESVNSKLISTKGNTVRCNGG